MLLDDGSIAYYGSEAVGEVLKLENSNNIESKHVVSAQLVVKKEEVGVVTYVPSTKYFVDVTTRVGYIEPVDLAPDLTVLPTKELKRDWKLAVVSIKLCVLVKLIIKIIEKKY